MRSAATARRVIDSRRPPPQLPRKRPHPQFPVAAYSIENLAACNWGSGIVCSNEMPTLPCPYPIYLSPIKGDDVVLVSDCWGPIKEKVLLDRKVRPEH